MHLHVCVCVRVYTPIPTPQLRDTMTSALASLPPSYTAVHVRMEGDVWHMFDKHYKVCACACVCICCVCV
jgi:hypothetical protein